MYGTLYGERPRTASFLRGTGIPPIVRAGALSLQLHVGADDADYVELAPNLFCGDQTVILTVSA